MQAQNVRTFLEAGIQSLLPQAQRLIELRRVLAGALPLNFRRSCTIANYMQGKVVIFAENSAIAAKLRLMEPELRDQFVKRAIQVTGITIKVQPKTPVPAREKQIQGSASAARSLLDLASQLPDSKLKTAVTALAMRHQEGKVSGD
jgi:hypothetical protein